MFSCKLSEPELPPTSLSLDALRARGLRTWRPQHEIDGLEYAHLENTRTAKLVARHQESGTFDAICQRAAQLSEANRVTAKRENPYVERKVKAIVHDWATLSRKQKPGIRDDQLWASYWVAEFATMFLCIRVSVTFRICSTRDLLHALLG